ncbi:MAG: TlpA family protein disulfide reductase [Crocinitomicaceae bacterium]|nr:TlpA family protein disulfide reductase [Crocinitomicaceae bacterium]
MRKKISKYLSNALLVFIILVLFIPSWRLKFRTTWMKLFMSDVEFVDNGRTSTSIDFPMFDSNDVLLNFQSLKGKPTILSFWRTWCAPCRAELPEIAKITEHYKGDLQVIYLTNETFEVIQGAGISVKEYPFIRYSPYQSADFEVDAFPTLFLLDKDLNIVSKITGGGNLLNDSNIDLINSLILEANT